MPVLLKDKKAILLKLREPQKVLDVIPTAKKVRHQGSLLVAVPHRPDETRVLRNLGFAVPDPMELYYTWPGKKPFDAQRETANFATLHDRCFILNSFGLGKTVTTLWAADYMQRVRQVHRVLVVCPLSTMEPTWAREAFFAFPEKTVVVLYGDRTRRLRLLEKPASIYIINTDGLRIIRDALASRPDIDLVILDEVAQYRNHGTDRWKIANTICNRQTPRRVWGLTGAPTPNSPVDAWAQCRLVIPASLAVPKYFNRYRDSVMRQVSQFKWVPRPEATQIVHDMMQPAIRFSLDDCVDLPPQTWSERAVELTAEQRTAYKEMLARLRTEYEGGQILAVNEAIKAQKLLQIAAGCAYGAGGQVIELPDKNRIEALLEVVEESEGKVLVFVPFTGVLRHVADALTKAGVPTAVVHGETAKSERDEIFHAFQNEVEPRVIVANPGTMSHGLTLTAATTVCWYAPIHSNEIFQQANARVRRPGQTRTTVIVTLSASDIERRIYRRLEAKESLQGVLLDLMEEKEAA